ncbi:MAG: hypothetical protein L3J74_13275 [Bacteroidales bacterium]|nr:hypothetical protein [Bacteroidales bacterium]
METITTAKSFAQTNCAVYSTALNDKNHAVLNPLNKMTKLKNKTKPDTARFYTIQNGAVEENIAFIDEESEQFNYLSDNEYVKEVILVLTGSEQAKYLENLFSELKDRLHTVIYEQNSSFDLLLSDESICVLKTDSITSAVTESYRIARDGQTIFFPNTHPDFDFFSHINFS